MAGNTGHRMRLRFREILAGARCIHPASVHDAVSARIAASVGFELGMFAGSVASLALLGAPDIVVPASCIRCDRRVDGLVISGRHCRSMSRLVAIIVALCLTGFAAATQPMLPRCTAALDGQMSEGGCSCDYDRGGQLTGHAAGWRWTCDLLHGPGAVAPVPPAGFNAPGLPPGFVYGPQTSSGTGRSTTGPNGY